MKIAREFSEYHGWEESQGQRSSSNDGNDHYLVRASRGLLGWTSFVQFMLENRENEKKNKKKTEIQIILHVTIMTEQKSQNGRRRNSNHHVYEWGRWRILWSNSLCTPMYLFFTPRQGSTRSDLSKCPISSPWPTLLSFCVSVSTRFLLRNSGLFACLVVFSSFPIPELSDAWTIWQLKMSGQYS